MSKYHRLNERKNRHIYEKLDELIQIMKDITERLDKDHGLTQDDFREDLTDALKTMDKELGDL